MSKESALCYVMDGGTLVGVSISCPTGASPQPTQTEMEILRIFSEHSALQSKLKLAEEANRCLREEKKILWGIALAVKSDNDIRAALAELRK